ncbi:MAG: hypothetical protein QM680_10055 [Luteolibacter sp.]
MSKKENKAPEDKKPQTPETMKITCNHYTSKRGIPVILDDYGNPYRYEIGIEKALEAVGWSMRRAAREVGCETEEAFDEVTRLKEPHIPLLNVLGAALERLESNKPSEKE